MLLGSKVDGVKESVRQIAALAENALQMRLGHQAAAIYFAY